MQARHVTYRADGEQNINCS